MPNEEEMPKKEMVLAREMALSAIKGESLNKVSQEFPSNIIQTMYAIAIGVCAQMNEKEALIKIRDNCPLYLLNGVLSEAMEIFAKEKQYYYIFKRIQDACSTNLLKAILSRSITDYAENETRSALNIIKAAGVSDLMKNILAQKMVDYAKNKKALNRIMIICSNNLKEEVLTLAITICRQPELTTLTLELSMVKFKRLVVPLLKNQQGEKKNPPSNDNDSSSAMKKKARLC